MKERLSDVMVGDLTMSEEFFATVRRSEPAQPERALLLAILEDAIHNYRKYSPYRDRAGKDRFHEAEHWIMHSKSQWIFSFENVCELLELDPEYLRRGLRDWRARTAKREKPRQRSPAAANL